MDERPQPPQNPPHPQGLAIPPAPQTPPGAGETPPPGRRGRTRKLLTSLLASATILALLLWSVNTFVLPTQTPLQAPANTTPAAGDIPTPLRPFYEQNITWSPCENGLYCTTVRVPLDYTAPEAESIDLALVTLPATGKSQGAVVVNPGGPGASGYNLVAKNGDETFSKKLRSSFDIVGFDPRGVQRSSPITCLTDQQRDQERQEENDLDTDTGFEAEKASMQKIIAACQEKTGRVLEFVDTASTVKDLDIIRAILGSKQLNYLGFSYGTKLGALYADAFPTKVGKFVLDGAMDPTMTLAQIEEGQAEGFEKAIGAWAKECASKRNCPVPGSAEQVVERIQELNRSYTAQPRTTSDGRKLNGVGFNAALSLALYSQSSWPILRQALQRAFSADPNGLMALADFAADRDPKTGSYTTNATFAFTAINCLDYPSNPNPEQYKSESRAHAKRLEQLSPTFGKQVGYGEVLCGMWPYRSKTPLTPVRAEGAKPIVIVGTTGDPATPYAWAQKLHEQLPSGRLLTHSGEGHTAYGRNSTCITATVDTYFVEDTVPEDGLRCQQ